VQFKGVTVLQISWKLLAMLPLTLEVKNNSGSVYIFVAFSVLLFVFVCVCDFPFKHWNQQCAGIVVFVALFLWDSKKEEEQIAQISRNETLSRLPLRLSTNRVVELVQLRDTVRPVSIYVIFSSVFSLPSALYFFIVNVLCLTEVSVLGYNSWEKRNSDFSFAQGREISH
jgi:hypothetical protein